MKDLIFQILTVLNTAVIALILYTAIRAKSKIKKAFSGQSVAAEFLKKLHEKAKSTD